MTFKNPVLQGADRDFESLFKEGTESIIANDKNFSQICTEEGGPFQAPSPGPPWVLFPGCCKAALWLQRDEVGGWAVEWGAAAKPAERGGRVTCCLRSRE